MLGWGLELFIAVEAHDPNPFFVHEYFGTRMATRGHEALCKPDVNDSHPGSDLRDVAAALRIQHPPPVKLKNEPPDQRTGGFERIAIDPERLKVSLQQSSKGFAGNVGHIDKAPVNPPRGWTIR